jgi:hypothetical protein
MSVIFSAALTGLGHIAHAAMSMAENFPHTFVEFELSQDGETIWKDCAEYSFVGFSEDGDFSTSVGVCPVAVGKKLGKIKYDSDCKVWQLYTGRGEYIMVKSKVDTAEVFKRVG